MFCPTLETEKGYLYEVVYWTISTYQVGYVFTFNVLQFEN